MIEIRIIIKDGKILDQLNDKNCIFSEVASALLRLKQIEQRLIDKEFENNWEIEDSLSD